MNGRMERNEIARMADPNLIHMVPMIKKAEANRRWYHRVNWYAVIGLGMFLTSATLIIWCFGKYLDTL